MEDLLETHLKPHIRLGRAAAAVLVSIMLGAALLPGTTLYADEIEEDSSSSAVLEEAPDAAAAQDAKSSKEVRDKEKKAAEQKAQEEAERKAQEEADKRAAEEEAAAREAEALAEEEAARAAEEEALSEEERKRLEKEQEALDKAQAVFDEAFAAAQEAEEGLAGLQELQDNLTPYRDAITSFVDRAKELNEQRKPYQEERKKLIAQREEVLVERDAALAKRDEASAAHAKALYGLIVVDEEIARTGGVDMLSVVLGDSNATEAEAYGYLLGKVADICADKVSVANDALQVEEANVNEVNAKLADLADQVEAADEKIAAIDKDREAVIEDARTMVGEGNKAAFDIERLCSESRQGVKVAIEKVEALKTKVDDVELEGIAELKEQAKSWDIQSNELRAAAQEDAGAFYDAVDTLGGVEGAISYGSGLDFALSEEEFVDKWGVAIDLYFGEQGAPLQGYGAEMAKQAYAFKVDPRLCAAVSIMESSGGRFCIKPHNAWGWGAADSDPYNLAFSWGSWEEAIRAWHEGMATSNTGLATASSLSRLGDIYCSSPIWSKNVANFMERISAIAEAQQVVYAT